MGIIDRGHGIKRSENFLSTSNLVNYCLLIVIFENTISFEHTKISNISQFTANCMHIRCQKFACRNFDFFQVKNLINA